MQFSFLEMFPFSKLENLVGNMLLLISIYVFIVKKSFFMCDQTSLLIAILQFIATIFAIEVGSNFLIY